MKKLMFAAVVASALTGVCSVESANVVGYQNKNTLADSAMFKFMAPTFTPISGEAMKLGDLKLEYGDGTEMDPGDPASQFIWTFSTGGSTENQYWYLNDLWAGWYLKEPGWYSDETYDTPANDIPLPYGMGVAVCASSDATKLVFCGAVKPTAANIDTYADSAMFYFTGNCMPVNYTLGDISLIYGDGTEMNPGDPASQFIWTFSTGGSTENQYWYLNELWAGWYLKEPGWYSDETYDTPANDVELNAGDGFAVCASEVIQVRIPSPLEK